MIWLSEDMVGFDASDVAVQGLQSCLALFVINGTGVIFGAHLTVATKDPGLGKLLEYIKNNAGGKLKWMAMVAKFAHWATAPNGLTTKEKLADHFRAKTGYAGKVYYCDATWGATKGYDVRCRDGKSPKLDSRTTPLPPNSTDTPSPDVWGLCGMGNTVLAQSGTAPKVKQMVPKNVGSWAPLSGHWSRGLKHV